MTIIESEDGIPIAYETFGSGESLVIIGGSLTRAADYAPIAQALATSFTVHVMDRRGRGASGPQGDEYSIQTDVRDALAVLTATGSHLVFGHSYGGLVALEAARLTPTIRRLAAYEPGVSINGSITGIWMPAFRNYLVNGDNRSAFACMAQQAGYAPSGFGKLPLRAARLLLKLAVRGDEWRNIEPLLGTQLAEHGEVVRLDNTFMSYATITAKTLLLSGGKSPAFVTSDMRTLRKTISNCDFVTLDGLEHASPSHGSPQALVESLVRFFGA